jgi:hypothetical protein
VRAHQGGGNGVVHSVVTDMNRGARQAVWVGRAGFLKEAARFRHVTG